MRRLRQSYYLIFLLTAFSCSQHKQPSEKRLIDKDTLLNELKEIYAYDTSLYHMHGSGFYLSKSGDVFQKNMLAWDDENGVWARHHWVDSLMDSSDPNTKTLKEMIDLNTYKSDGISYFATDKNHVYFVWTISDGTFRFIVEKADPKTFVGIKERWGKDRKYVFYGTDIVRQADVNSFRVFDENPDSARDKNHIYLFGKIEK